ncbi:MAG TPA: dihydrodipicolinate synthase family protein [Pyrinomonadaceae bacterium]|nr:dihydrodipicolinate synthase family protein [Pyrinomonadaceae bacterium]
MLIPFTTPFFSNGELDLQSLKANLNNWNKTGIKGYVALGSTGERVNLDEREYLEVIEAARAEVPEQRTFIVGAGQQSTLKTIAEIKLAAAAGADAVLVLTPHYYRPAITQEVLLDYYRAVADASPVEIILYSMPPLTGIKIEPQTVAQLSEHQNIIGVKDSSADVEEFTTTLRIVANNFSVLTGNGTVLRETFLAGAAGGILAVGCVVPEVCLEIFEAIRSHDDDRAARLQKRLTPLAAAVTVKYGIGGLKAALDMNGYKGGSVRAPLPVPGSRAREEIALLLNEVQAALDAPTALDKTAKESAGNL